MNLMKISSFCLISYTAQKTVLPSDVDIMTVLSWKSKNNNRLKWENTLTRKEIRNLLFVLKYHILSYILPKKPFQATIHFHYGSQWVLHKRSKHALQTHSVNGFVVVCSGKVVTAERKKSTDASSVYSKWLPFSHCTACRTWRSIRVSAIEIRALNPMLK